MHSEQSQPNLVNRPKACHPRTDKPHIRILSKSDFSDNKEKKTHRTQIDLTRPKTKQKGSAAKRSRASNEITKRKKSRQQPACIEAKQKEVNDGIGGAGQINTNDIPTKRIQDLIRPKQK